MAYYIVMGDRLYYIGMGDGLYYIGMVLLYRDGDGSTI